MENNWVLKVQNVSKNYNDALHRAPRVFSFFGGKPRRHPGKSREMIRALHNINFVLKKGEILGIIGRNGAGKSTILKIISEITSPTSGSVTIKGKLTSILDVGTGFHPDLTGRENVYLSASMMGLSKKQVQERYRDIVFFSGVEDYMHLPVKKFSSGMYLRLALSVALHSAIDILLLDEVMSVGDVDFVRRCNQRIRDLTREGASILLASHNLIQISEFCDRCILIDQGQIICNGSPFSVIQRYIEQQNHSEKVEPSNYSLDGLKHKFIEKLEVRSAGQTHFEPLYSNKEIEIYLELINTDESTSIEVSLYLTNMEDIRVLMDSYAFRNEYQPQSLPRGHYAISCILPKYLLRRGIYRLGMIYSRNMQFQKEFPFLMSFKVNLAEEERNLMMESMNAVVQPRLEWTMNKLPEQKNSI